MVFSLNPLDQARLLAISFHRLVHRAAEAQVPLIFPVFPRMVEDWEYLYCILKPILSNVPPEAAQEAHTRVASLAKVRIGDEVGKQEGQSGAEDVFFQSGIRYPSTLEVDNIALRREIRRIREERLAADAAIEKARINEERLAADAAIEKARINEERLAADAAIEKARINEERLAADAAIEKARINEERLAADAAIEKARISEARNEELITAAIASAEERARLGAEIESLGRQIAAMSLRRRLKRLFGLN